MKGTPARWKRVLRGTALALLLFVLCVGYLIKDHVRTLQSLRRVPGTNTYVMDYYVDYNIDEIRAHGMDVNNIEDDLIGEFFPDVIAPIAKNFKERYVAEAIRPVPATIQRCSTVVLRPENGKVFFGRNLDYSHDANLILRIHREGKLASVAVLDLHYLNLDRDDLDATNLIERIPLLFAPYYLEDGINEYGVAVADMTVEGVKTPYSPEKPDVIHSSAMRLILDYAKSTEEAIRLLDQYNIHFVETSCHLMIADRSGDSAVVECIDGKLVVTRTDEHWQVCTNHQIAGKTEEENDRNCERYHTASDRLAKLSGDGDASDVMKVMESVSKDNWTMWTSVYDLTSGEFRVAYRRHYDNVHQDHLPLAK